jgi:lysophospholipase L1-like esterase
LPLDRVHAGHYLPDMTKQLLVLMVLAASSPDHWIGTWSAATEPAQPDSAQTFRNQTVRLIVHVSAGGKHVRVRLSNRFGDAPLVIGSAHVARRAAGADTIPGSDRKLAFGGTASVTIPAGSETTSDPMDLKIPARSDLAISLYFAKEAKATTSHALALQTSYLSAGDATAAVKFRATETLSTWPFLTGVDVVASARSAAIVAFGSSLTDGDGSTEDANHRWPDLLAARLHACRRARNFGVLNAGLIGNRLLHDSPRAAGNPFGPMLGEAGLKRFEYDVLAQAGVEYVLVALGVNDILFPAFPFTPPDEAVTSDALIAGYRQLIARAHEKGVRVIGTTIPPFEGAKFEGAGLNVELFTPDRERLRAAVNQWIRQGGAFDGIADFDQAVRDPAHPTRLLPAYAAEDHLHVNDAGNEATAKALGLSELFGDCRGRHVTAAHGAVDRVRAS